MPDIEDADRADADRADADRADADRAGDPPGPLAGPDAPRNGHRGLHLGSGPVLARLHPSTLVAYAWATVAARQAKRAWANGLQPGQILLTGPPRGLPEAARRGMLAALRRQHASCLIEATVRQRWDRAHGRDRELVIGVTAPKAGFSAHAWLEGDPPCCSGGFTELTRR